jgi:hypothetical protein
MIMTRTVEPLSTEEHKRVRGTVKIFAALACIMFIVCVISDISVINSNDWTWDQSWFLAFPFLILSLSYLFVARLYIRIPLDLKANLKFVADTTVLRKKKWGFFDMDARGGLSNVMMGSAYYIYVADDTRHSGKRKFRVLMDAYDTLQPGDKVRVAWLPKSGQILSIDMPDFHWVAWDRRPGDHG